MGDLAHKRRRHRGDTCKQDAEDGAGLSLIHIYCKIAKVVAVEKKVRRRRDDIIAAVELGISNGRVEALSLIHI